MFKRDKIGALRLTICEAQLSQDDLDMFVPTDAKAYAQIIYKSRMFKTEARAGKEGKDFIFFVNWDFDVSFDVESQKDSIFISTYLQSMDGSF